MSQDYQIEERVNFDGDIPVTFYSNKITGLKVVTSFVECPIVKGNFVLATEAFDDDGLPHTLEHLVFLGSDEYPYKGVMDLIANRCLANGTNAYTDTDHTAYTLSTAGSDGFLNMLPIYLDHILFATLTDEGYVTEVHHINGEGENAGTVYCEMQGCENSGESRCNDAMVRALYPGACGYKFNTGGKLENLRNTTNNAKVRDYHKQFYHSKNLCVIVIGPVEAEAIFKAIKPIEDKIVARGMNKIEFERPWQTPVEPLAESVNQKIQYPSDTDDDGLVYIGYRGPNVITNYKDFLAIGLLLDYLNGTAISPIQRDFVECEDAYCSSVCHGLVENSTSEIYLTFESVGKDYLDLVDAKLAKLLQNIANGKEKIDMDRLQNVLSRKIVRILSTAETSPSSLVLGGVIGHFLYGARGSLEQRAREIPVIKEFMKCDSNFWLELLDRYMVGPSSRKVCIVGQPDQKFMQSMAETEKARIAAQRKKLINDLPQMAKILKESIEANEIPPPESMLKSVPIPTIDNIKFHPIEREVLDKSLLPFRLQYDSIRTNFVSINLFMDTSNNLTQSERLYLPLLTEMLMETPIERDGKVIPYEQVVDELFSDTITYGTCIGISQANTFSVGIAGMLIGISMQVETIKYEKAVNWLSEFLYKTIFTQERIKTVTAKMVSDISQYRRSGSKVTGAVANGMIYQSNSNQWATNFIRQQKFLKKLLATMKTDPQSVVEKITRIRDDLARPENIFVHLTLNKDKVDIGQIHEPLLKLIPRSLVEPTGQHINLKRIIPCHKLVKPLDDIKSAIVGVGSIESNYLTQCVKSINDPMDPDLAAVFVLIQYLTQLEGPLWRQIRGLGLSYSASIYLSVSEGLMYLSLFKSAQVVSAYKESAKIVNSHLSGEEEFDDNLFESAKSSLIYDFIKREKSAYGKSMQSLIAHLRDIDINFNRELIKRISLVSKDDLRRVGLVYLKPLIENVDRRTIVCCNPSKIDDVCKGFQSMRELTKLNINEEAFLNAIE